MKLKNNYINICFVLLLFCILLAGCGHPQWLQQVNSYSATAPALNQAASTFTEVNKVHILQEQIVLASNYTITNYHPGEFSSLMADKDTQTRLTAIKVLIDYTSLIHDLSSGKQEKEISTSALDQDSIIEKAITASSNLTDQQTLQVACTLSVLDSILKPILAHKIQKRLPPLMKAADPHVQVLYSLLEADLNTLRTQTHGDYQVLLMEQSKFINENRNRLSSIDQRNEIQRLFQIETNEAKDDSDLVQAISGLKQMADEHHKIVGGLQYGSR